MSNGPAILNEPRARLNQMVVHLKRVNPTAPPVAPSISYRAHGLTIADVTGHYAWDRVNRPYDPSHPGWKPGDSKETGLFSWNRFVADVAAEVERATREAIPIQVVDSDGAIRSCESGQLIESTTFIPLRAYTQCLIPEATVSWDDAQRSVTVELPER